MPLHKDEGFSDEGFEETKVDSAQMFICPCISFSSSAQVVSALSSTEKAERLMQWIQGGSIQDDGEKFEKISLSKNLMCGRSQNAGFKRVDGQPTKCVHRVGAAYCILNAIRDGCRVFLENEIVETKQIRATKEKAAKTMPVDEPKYDEAFPSLSSTPTPNILKPKKKLKKKLKPIQLSTASNSQPTGNLVGVGTHVKSINVNKIKVKRRIRPAPVAPQQQTPWGNISALQTVPPMTISWPKAQKNTKPANLKDPMARIMSDKYIAPVESGNKSASMTMAKPNSLQDPMDRVVSSRVHVSTERASKASTRTSVAEKDGIKKLEPSATVDELKELMSNTVDVYCTIITSQLAPSTAVELQLILRMLALCDEDYFTNNDEGHETQGLEKLFKRPSSCRQFASKVLQKLQNLIVNFDHDILVSLLGMKSFVDQMPELAISIQMSLESHRNALLSEGKYGQDDVTTSLAVSGKTTILSVPFQQKRDSRHNYRSRDQTSIYNNREQCRDAFLFQLRAFQQMRGTVLNPTQVHQCLNTIILALRQMIDQLLPSNTPWFAELFTDLLLQIGLVPMQELDADILKNVADKDRLQKLHSRFTSKVAQKNKSSKALVLRGNDASSGPSPEEFFTEHQEFFYLFIKSVDSYVFSTHLQRRLVHLLLTLSSTHEDKGLERRISELKMLSKFLGLLVFSPNWNVNARDVIGDSLCHHFAPVIPINNIVKDAYKEGNLILVVPWVLNFLRMMSWDSVSKQLPYYTETFSMLRSIQKQMFVHIFEGYTPLGTNMLSIEMQLDAFFPDVIGLVEAELLSDYKLPRKTNVKDYKSLDTLPFKFSPQFVLSSSTHLDDFYKLVADLSREWKFPTASGASKKLKPYMLSTNQISPTSALLQPGMAIDNERFGPLSALDQGKLQGFLSKNTTIERHGPGKLVDTFFHQHKHLQHLCEFVIDYCIDHVLSKRCLEECITPAVRRIAIASTSKHVIPSPIDLDWYLQILENIEKGATCTVSHYTKQVLHDYITNAMETLVPSYVDVTVKEIATNLSIDHALRKGEVLVNSLVRTEAKKAIDSQLHPKNNGTMDPKLQKIHPNSASFDESLVKNIYELNASSANIMSVEQCLPKAFIEKIKAVTKEFDLHTDTDLIADAATVTAGISLVQTMAKIVAAWLHPPTKINDTSLLPHGFNDILHLVARIGRIGFAPEHVSAFGSLVSNPTALRQIVHRFDDFDNNIFQHDCIGGKLMRKADLANGLFDIIENHPMSQEAMAICLGLMHSIR